MSTRRFSTFEGVFTPCLLSILGVIMYLRLGWVVGQVGLGGAFVIIGFANLITLATALSMSSVVTNIRIGAGGAYSMITKSLGVEAGGAIGIPLYISQAVSIAFYITGFTECWLFVFPEHNGLFISLILWASLLFVSYFSTRLAFRVQFGVLALVALSLLSIFLGEAQVHQPNPFLNIHPHENFWSVFAIFFPAVTGILAGASMSGELADPKKAIPFGTLGAIGLSLIVYVLLAYWFAKQVSLEELQTNTGVVLKMGRWRWLVILGILGATLSSALSMFVSSPRVLMALGKHSLVPLSGAIKHLNKRDEPTTAILFTALIVLITLLIGTLDQIAALLTMFFLITYGMINFTVFLEQTIGIVSFRPTFRVPRIVSLLGSIGCLVVMLLVDIKFSIISMGVIIIIYWMLIKKEAQVYSPDIRSGILVFLAESFGKVANRLPYYPKIWKPNLVVPINDIQKFSKVVPFLRNVISPSGRITAFRVMEKNMDVENKSFSMNNAKEEIDLTLAPIKEEGLFVEATVVEASDVLSGTVTVMQTLRGMFFPPNVLFYILKGDAHQDASVKNIMNEAAQEGLGIILLVHHPKNGFHLERTINLWVRQQSPNIDLSILVALQLEKNWEGTLRIVQVVSQESQRYEAVQYLKKLKDLLRLPVEVEVIILVGEFQEVLKNAPEADINIFGMQEDHDLSMVRDVAERVQTSVLFLKDSKQESALA